MTITYIEKLQSDSLQSTTIQYQEFGLILCLSIGTSRHNFGATNDQTCEHMVYPGNYFLENWLIEEEIVEHFLGEYRILQGLRQQFFLLYSFRNL